MYIAPINYTIDTYILRCTQKNASEEKNATLFTLCLQVNKFIIEYVNIYLNFCRINHATTYKN